MDDLELFTPCLCVECNRLVVTAGHECKPGPPQSVLAGVVLLGQRRQLIATMAKRRRGRR
jgi:hypothetical protein